MTSGRKGRVLGVVGRVLACIVTFVAAAVVALAVHLDLPAARRLVATQATAIANEQIAGTIAIDRIGALGLSGIRGVEVRVLEPDGAEVLHAEGVEVRVRTIDAARSALFGKGPIHVDVPYAAVDRADVSLDPTPDGELRLVRALGPREQAPPTEQEEGAPGRGVRIEAPRLAVGRARISGAPGIDAELGDLAASAHVDPEETRAVLDRVDLVTRGLPNGVDPRGRLRARVVLPSKETSRRSIEAVFDGFVAGMITTLDASLEGDRVDARLEASGPGLATMLGEKGSRDELTLHVDVRGELPRLTATIDAAHGRARVDLDATVDTSVGTHVDARLEVRGVDLARIQRGAPSSDLGLSAAVNVTIDEGGFFGWAALDTLPGVLADRRVPPARVRASAAGERIAASAVVLDPSMPARIDVNVIDRIVEARLAALVPDLRRVPYVGASAGGRARVEARGRAALDAKSVDVEARVRGEELDYEGHRVAALDVHASASGSFERPVLVARLAASGVVAAGVALDRVEARARVECGETTVVREASIEAARGDERFGASAEAVTVGQVVEVRGAVVEGLGQPIRAEMRRDALGLRANVDAPRIDLARAARLLGKERDVTEGTLSIRGDVDLQRTDAQGSLRARAEHVTVRSIRDTSLSLDASVRGGAIDVALDARFDSAGHARLRTTDLRIDGSALDPSAWARARGRIAFDAALDMGRFVELVPEGTLPVGELGGELTMVGTIRRDGPGVPPEIHLHGHTRGLVVSSAAPLEPDPPGIEALGPSRRRVRDVDVGFDLDSDGRSGHTVAAFRVTDAKSTVVSFDAKVDVPYGVLLARPKEAKRLLARAPISARVVVPVRTLAEMPALLGLGDVEGTVALTIDASGTALEPNVRLAAAGRGLRARDGVPPAEAELSITYDGSEVLLAATADVEGRRALAADAQLALKSADAIEGAPPWIASARVSLDELPLAILPPTKAPDLGGRVSGQVVVDGLHRDAKAFARLALRDLAVGGAKYTSGSIAVDATEGHFGTRVRLDQPDGFVALTSSAGLRWGARTAPELTDDRIDAHLVAKNFRAAVLQPFVTGALDDLDGRIDADARVAIDRARGALQMRGGLSFREGKMHVAALGEELRDVRAKVRLDPSGVVTVEDVYARGIQGELTAGAEARLVGTKLAGAQATVEIPKRRPMNLALGGQPIGEVHGRASLVAKPTPEGLDVAVDVPSLAVELPQVLKSGVQRLEEQPRIRVGVFRTPSRFVRLPLDEEDLRRAKPPSEQQKLEVDVRLAKVDIRRGNQLEVVLEGNPKITITDETTLRGQVRVKRGWIDVQGKKFEVENGTVTFTGESPPNPTVVATAGWTAHDGTRVFADFTGPVETGRLDLRSEPARPKNEILAIILFGSAEGANPSPAQGRSSEGTTRAAVGLGGGLAARGINEALQDLGGIEANVRVDTTRANNPRPELEVQVAPRIAVRFSHVIGTPPITEPDRNLATIQWRFRPRWTLETTFGDRGRAELDAIWQKRY